MVSPISVITEYTVLTDVSQGFLGLMEISFQTGRVHVRAKSEFGGYMFHSCGIVTNQHRIRAKSILIL